MQTLVNIIFVVAAVTFVVTFIRAIKMKPREILAIPNSDCVYPAYHFRSVEAHEKRWNKNQLIVKISFAITGLLGIVKLILLSI